MDNKTEKFQYMIFIFGNFKNDDELVRLIATQISPFTNKDSYLKYNYGFPHCSSWLSKKEF